MKTFHLSDQPVPNAATARLKAMLDRVVNRRERAKSATRLEVLWQDMATAGDLLTNALLAEQEFDKAIALSQSEAEVFDRWKRHRENIQRMAEQYASAVEIWREELIVECEALQKRQLKD